MARTLTLTADVAALVQCLREMEEDLAEAPAVTRAFVESLLQRVDPLCDSALGERRSDGSTVLLITPSEQLRQLANLVRQGQYHEWQAYLCPHRVH